VRTVVSLTLASLILISFKPIGTSSVLAKDGEVKALSAKKVTFLGVNFSKFKLVNQMGFIDKNGRTKCKALSFKYFESWNDVFLTESGKSNMNNLLRVEKAKVSLKKSLELNTEIDTEGCLIEDGQYSISKSDIQDVVDDYDLELEGISVLMVAESISKKLEYGVYYIVYFDSERNILYSRKYQGEPSGGGFDNYWVNTIFDSLEKHAKSVKKERKSLGID
tara:strand:+ start:5165 stop:5827 length:663 start_codon:yes stop_codon:yes gene_type:complete